VNKSIGAETTRLDHDKRKELAMDLLLVLHAKVSRVNRSHIGALRSSQYHRNMKARVLPVYFFTSANVKTRLDTSQ
jgi:hypothetical protein